MKLLIVIVILLVSFNSHAAEIQGAGNFGGTLDVAKVFTEQIPSIIDKIFSDPVFENAIRNLFIGFSIIFIVTYAAKFIANDLKTSEMFSALIVYGFVSIGMVWFDTFLFACLSLTEGMGMAVQGAILDSDNPNYPVEFMVNIVSRFQVNWEWNIFTIADRIIEVLILFIVSLLFILLAMAAVIASLIQSFLFLPISIVGKFVLPFILMPMFSFLFDGWLRLFISIILFGFIARMMVSIAVYLLALMFNIKEIDDFSGRIFEWNMDNVLQILGAASVALLCLYGVLNAYALSASIVSGNSNSLLGGGAVKSLNEKLSASKLFK